MVGKNSKIWIHFDRVTEYMVSCKHCGKSLSSKHTSSNLARHLCRQHKSLAEQFNIEDEKGNKIFSPNKTPTESKSKRRISDLEDYFSKENNEAFGTEISEQSYILEAEPDVTMVKNEVQQGSRESVYIVNKLRAETRYFNEMALLARAKRRLIEVRIEKFGEGDDVDI